ncbi:glyoxalase/bleomycin resistance/dioxygenase family protein [Paenibacillus sp. CCS19]|uniref:VOC family protein n=1 Tax=Paenibacillus sp. CCS19 TaxID=3158387 RepID=UPI00256331AD|nr:VOC family protein [Paenibacillus cellulosilyticus]GMK37745.1 glyoxalase/bleomycin resistance/dioxygenase family protein [Paenibacillus cellulosilyticus]
MKVKLEGITLIATEVAVLAAFYRDVIGFEVVVEEDHYAELKNEGVRLAICSRSLMADNTHGHESYGRPISGQAVELNFECDSPEQVYALFEQFVAQGAVAVADPVVKDWGHTTGFFADPEGNIHSLFAVNP